MYRNRHGRRSADWVAWGTVLLATTGSLSAPPGRSGASSPRPIEHWEQAEGELVPRAEQPVPERVQSRVTVTHGRFTSQQVNVDAFGNNIPGDAANEPSIAIDPTDPDIMAVGWREFSTVTNAFRQSGYGFSQDGGATWTFPGVVLPPPNNFASDPVLDFDADGNFYYSSLQTQRNNVCTWSIYMYKSFDGGMTWPQDIFAWGGDKQWVAIDRTNGIGRGHIYMSSTPNINASCVAGLNFTRSTDGGLTFENPIALPAEVLAGSLDVGPDGNLHLIGSTITAFPQVINYVRSSDAQDPNVTPTFDLHTIVDLDGTRAFGGTPNPGGLLGQFWIKTDHSGGLFHGNIYVLASVVRSSISDPSDVMIVRSEDNGWTFSEPVRVNDDTPGNGAYQWFGTVSVAPNGRIDASWYDTRDDPTHVNSQLRYSFSLDGGETWSPSETVGPVFNSTVGFPVQQKIGDYTEMISLNDAAVLAYSATYNGEEDVYVVKLTPDCNGNGVADVDDIAGPTSDDCNGNLTPDECEPSDDCNLNGVQDVCDVAGATSDDCNHNGVPDDCEPNEDCNSSGTRDICETIDDFDLDCDQNGVPDSCELGGRDCNGSGVIDACDVIFRTSDDCNGNLIPDECDIEGPTSEDVNGDDIPDECTGACCLCDSCVVATESGCFAQGGIFDGVGVACVDAACPSPINDSCADAEIISGEETVSIPFDNRCATTDGPTSYVCEAPAPVTANDDIWYEYTAPCCGILSLEMCDFTTDGILAVYGGNTTCECPAVSDTPLTCNDDGCGPASGGSLTMPVTEGACYTIQVAGFGSQQIPAEGTGTLNLSVTCIPGGGPLEIEPLGHWDTDAGTAVDAGAFHDVTADGDTVYLAQVLDNKVHFFDISDPNNPDRFLEWVVGSVNSGASAEDVQVGDGLLFISLWGDGFDGVEIVDVRNPLSPVHLTWMAPLGFNDVRNTFYANGYLYLATDLGPQIGVVDLTGFDPDSPQARIDSTLWTVNAGTNTVQDITVRNGVMYVAARNSGLLLYDVSDIANQAPALLGAPSVAQPQTNHAWPSDDGRWVVTAQEVSGGAVHLYEVVPNGPGFDVLLRDTVSYPSSVMTSPHNVVVDGTRVYVAWMEGGLRVFDIDENTAKLAELGNYPTYYQPPIGSLVGAHGVFPFLGESRILVADMHTGLHIVQLVDQRALISYPAGRPELVNPALGTAFQVEVAPGCEDLDPSTAMLFVCNLSIGPDFVEQGLTPLGGDLYDAILPPADCPSTTDYYVSVETLSGRVVTDPPDAPRVFHTAKVGARTGVVFEDDFETDKGWALGVATCAGVGTQTGNWSRVDPNGTLLQPENDATSGAGTTCYVTGTAPAGSPYSSADVDGGPFRLTSPTIAIGGSDVTINYARWFYSILYSPGFEDFLVVEVSGDGGGSWTQLESIPSQGPQWQRKQFLLSDFMAPSATLTLRFTVSDCPNDGVSEAGIDDVLISAVGCAECPLVGPPLDDALVVAKNRYLSVRPTNPGVQSAMRVTLLSSAQFPQAVGSQWWIGPAQEICENSGQGLNVLPDDCGPAPGIADPTLITAPLQCTPHCADWGAIDRVVHVGDQNIVPAALYQVTTINCACDIHDLTAFSSPLPVATAVWSDTVLDCTGCPCGPPNGPPVNLITDCVSILQKFTNNNCAVLKTRADIRGTSSGLPDKIIDIVDVIECVGAFSGGAFPFGAPAGCP